MRYWQSGRDLEWAADLRKRAKVILSTLTVWQTSTFFSDRAPNEVNGEFSLWGRGGVTLLMLMFFVRRSRSLMLFSEDFSITAAPVNTDETCCFPTHITMITYSLLDAQFPRRNRIC